jgi:hypothetical protein
MCRLSHFHPKVDYQHKHTLDLLEWPSKVCYIPHYSHDTCCHLQKERSQYVRQRTLILCFQPNLSSSGFPLLLPHPPPLSPDSSFCELGFLCVAQVGFKLKILLPQFSKSWNYNMYCQYQFQVHDLSRRCTYGYICAYICTIHIIYSLM